jgi:hypothetical protein
MLLPIQPNNKREISIPVYIEHPHVLTSYLNLIIANQREEQNNFFFDILEFREIWDANWVFKFKQSSRKFTMLYTSATVGVNPPKEHVSTKYRQTEFLSSKKSKSHTSTPF